ncbi:DNA excision repair protein ERCC-8 [Zychaea mexicana]|uniref:DNA excision repair protein ERCC-8 n=1 Tax=Zychaea mexicana TaxID=64656 RepID=UPI0022FDF1D1|nr:DNA excision repair protein ERCC-8 [Zychaea mexicana]KAI9492454.1 DNA excision repair protein ERCC-8 [Zychaea mexicana]
MYSFLKKREHGTLRPWKFVRAESTKRAYSLQLSPTKEVARAHRGSVQSIKVENIEQRYMLSGGGDGRIHVYDLNTPPNKDGHVQIEPIASVSRKNRHNYAVTTVAWFPFDTGMFVSSSSDNTIRVWDTNSMTPACVFDLESHVHCQAISPVASHCLVASAADEPRIRLCDLKSGASTHSLTGHNGSVLSVAWSPRQDHVLYSGGNDGTVRVWDIRRARSCLMSLDQHNAVNNDPLADTNKAHGAGVNGLVFSSDSERLITLGLDEKIRMWDAYTGRNTLVNYGSLWRNRFQWYMEATVSGPDVWPPLLYVPSDDQQVLVYELNTGRLSRRLKGAYGRVTCVEKRAGLQELYSGSIDCEVLVWEPAEDHASTMDDEHPSEEDAWSESEEE